MISAKVIEHSINQFGDELITIQTKSPKFLDAELCKHRMVSANSSSDRAIPFNKIKSRPKFIPRDVRLNERGMQGYTQASPAQLEAFQNTTQNIFDYTVNELSTQTEIHKQHINRYLIAFTYQDKVMTANREQWDYFLGLRDAKDADPAIQVLAWCIKSAINNSIAVDPANSIIHPGVGVHLPYITANDMVRFDSGELDELDLIKISCARCARVSYLTHDNKATVLENDLKLYDFLVSAKHHSALEHVAIPESKHTHDARLKAYDLLIADNLPANLAKQVLYTANYKGWVQHRKTVE